MAFQFLNKLSEFIYKSPTDWSDVVGKQLESHNRKFKEVALHDQVSEVKDIMVRNIDEMVRRGERLEALQANADALVNNAVTFNVQSRRVRRTMWWQNTKVKIFMVLTAVILLYIIVTASCGGILWPSCIGSSSSGHHNDTMTSDASFY